MSKAHPTHPLASHVQEPYGLEKVLDALKASGVVIPEDVSVVGKLSSELSGKAGGGVSADWGGLALTHVVLVWRY